MLSWQIRNHVDDWASDCMSIAILKEITMYIAVEHTITNQEEFFELVPKVSEAPSGIKALQFFPSMDKKQAICLWEANSVNALKEFLEPLTAKSSRNIYFLVDNKKSIGLPILAPAA